MSILDCAPCAVCRRASKGYAIQRPGAKIAAVCSDKCGVIYMRTGPVNADEKSAITKGGNAAGTYLDSIGVFDMSRLTPAQWAQFCETLFVETCAELERMADEIPF